VSLGNDVVDLDDPESRLDTLHPRWTERVFAPPERAALARASDEPPAGPSRWSERHRLHWALWAAKESAYKAEKRLASETVFSPREYVAELPPPAEGGVAAGRVTHHGETFRVEVRFDGACLHAVASKADRDHSPVFSGVATAQDPLAIQGLSPLSPPSAGDAARRLASTTLASVLGLVPERLEIAGRPPTVVHDGQPTGVCLSLSHHGRFVAFAAALAWSTTAAGSP
jgi:phosphopantetheinyl transferase (holo-ACP synthase)